MPRVSSRGTTISTSTRVILIVGAVGLSLLGLSRLQHSTPPSDISRQCQIIDNVGQCQDVMVRQGGMVAGDEGVEMKEAVLISATPPSTMMNKKLRIGLAGATNNNNHTPHQPTIPLPPAIEPPSRIERFVDQVGDLVLALFGFDESDWFGSDGGFENDDRDDEITALGIEGGGNGSGLSSWTESSLYVERTNSMHPSRPSAFGPHLLTSPLHGLLFPIDSITPASSSYGCSSTFSASSSDGNDDDEKNSHEKKGWIALIQRGQCPFSQKVRFAQRYGARAVVFGDEDESEGGIRGGHGLLTPWSPDDTSDVEIPSIFVSRASYLSLLKTWEEEQSIVNNRNNQSKRQTPSKSTKHDQGTQTDLRDVDGEGEREFVGLEVVLSKDEMFAWPMLDLLFLLLFLPSLLTLITVFLQRLRLARAQKAERAPKDAVAKLVVFKWGEAPEKSTTTTTTNNEEGGEVEGAGVGEATTRLVEDEEREIGLNDGTSTRRTSSSMDTTTNEVEGPTETTSLLVTPVDEPSTNSSSSSLFDRLLTTLRIRRRRSPIALHSSSSSTSLPLRGPSPRYPSLTECTICLDNFVYKESIVMELPCGHLFHKDCCVVWLLEQRGICPICRRSVMEEEEEEHHEEVVVGGVADVPTTTTNRATTSSTA